MYAQKGDSWERDETRSVRVISSPRPDCAWTRFEHSWDTRSPRPTRTDGSFDYSKVLGSFPHRVVLGTARRTLAAHPSSHRTRAKPLWRRTGSIERIRALTSVRESVSCPLVHATRLAGGESM